MTEQLESSTLELIGRYHGVGATDHLLELATACIAETKRCPVNEVDSADTGTLLNHAMMRMDFLKDNVLGEYERSKGEAKDRLKKIVLKSRALRIAVSEIDWQDKANVGQHVDEVVHSMPMDQDELTAHEITNNIHLVEIETGKYSRHQEHLKGYYSLEHSVNARLDLLEQSLAKAIGTLKSSTSFKNSGHKDFVTALALTLHDITGTLPKSGFSSAESNSNNKGLCVGAFAMLVRALMKNVFENDNKNEDWINDGVRKAREWVEGK